MKVFLQKIIIIVKCILKAKYLEKKKITYLIFDNIASHELNLIIEPKKSFVLKVRFNEIKCFYFNKNIIFIFCRYFFLKKYGLYNSYLVSLICELNPKIIITFIDNSFKFFEIAKVLKDKFKFIAIQNAARYDILRHKYEYKKKIRSLDVTKKFFIPHYLCFGELEIEHYKKNKIKIENFYSIGSLRLINAINFFDKKKILIEKNKYDVCLISETGFKLNENYRLKNIEKNWAKMAKFTIQYCIRNKKKFIFASKRQNSQDFQNEISFYKKYLNNLEYNFLMKNLIKNDSNEYSSYKAILESNVAVAIGSTMLREKLSMKQKILTCNYTNINVFNFPAKEFYVLKKKDVNSFNKKLNFILNISEEKFFDKIKKKNFIIKLYNKNSLKFVKQIINQIK